MSCQLPKNLYNALPRICIYRNVYDKHNNQIGIYTGFSARPTATSDGHIQILTPEGNLWIRGEGIYIEGMGIKLTKDVIVDT